jgi:hypothetical protein
MSSTEEIQEVYESEIANKTKIVYNKFGKPPFYDGFEGFHLEGLFDGLGIEQIKCSEFTPKSRKKAKCLR